jgi:uncharacterized protein YfaS (alpha-2-macroglobulin family)
VKKTNVVVAGVTVTFVVTGPTGVKSTYTAVTSSTGVATYKGTLTLSAPRGTYLVTASASNSGLSASTTGNFVY